MAKQIDIANQKGGTTKTEKVIQFGIYLGKFLNKRILILDEDGSNCSLSGQMIEMEPDSLSQEGNMPTLHPKYEQYKKKHPKWNGRSSVASIFKDEPVVPYPTNFKNVDILPAHSSALEEVNGTHRDFVKNDINEKYKSWFFSSDIQKNYDWILIDHAPTKTLIGNASLNISSGLIIPIEPSSQSINGMKAMIQRWSQLSLARTIENPLKLLGIVINKYDKRIGLQQGMTKMVENSAIASKYLVKPYIGYSKYILEKGYERLVYKTGSIFDLPETNPIRQSFVEVCQTLHERAITDEE